jgi:hypothetical protein
MANCLRRSTDLLELAAVVVASVVGSVVGSAGPLADLTVAVSADLLVLSDLAVRDVDLVVGATKDVDGATKDVVRGLADLGVKVVDRVVPERGANLQPLDQGEKVVDQVVARGQRLTRSAC